MKKLFYSLLFIALCASSSYGQQSSPTVTVTDISQNQIWIKDMETGELKMIGVGSWPKFSPDGKQVVFISYSLDKSKNKQVGTICIMSIEGENKKQITNPDFGDANQPSWSPDGKHIVFQFTKKDKKDADIYTIDVNGENLKQHTTNESNDFSPYWTTDNFIYFSSDRGSKRGNYQIYRFKITI